MADCAYLSGNTTIRIDNVQCEYYLLDPTEYAQLQTLLAGSLPADDPGVALLLTAITGLLALAWTLKQVANLFDNNKR